MRVQQTLGIFRPSVRFIGSKFEADQDRMADIDRIRGLGPGSSGGLFDLAPRALRPGRLGSAALTLLQLGLYRF